MTITMDNIISNKDNINACCFQFHS